MSKKLIYVSSLALLSLAGATKVYAADSDYSTLKPHSMLTTAYAAAWNDVNKASDAKGTGDGKAAQEEKAEGKDGDKGDDKGDNKDSKDSGKKDSGKGKGSSKGSSKGSNKGSSKGSSKNSEKRKEQLKAQEKAEKQIAEIQKQNNRNNYYGNGGTVAHGNGGY